ncbi:hypothetical protein [Sphingobium xenophagum]|uniref:hypothetical protein n=1 Tax=Sphingobium xenophagum TaxID=121428 RepID=UPI00102FD52F|nr:hypothetical protein [Sphingobium xenophagum]
MKLQIAGLCLAEHSYLQFRITPTKALIQRLGSTEGLKEHLRDRLRVRLRRAFGREPWFFFAIEDRSTEGELVAPHIHGSVRIVPMPLPKTKAGQVRARWAKAADRDGQAVTELAFGKLLLKLILRYSAGPERTAHHSWSQVPLMSRSNPEWISYALKNMYEPSADLPERRMVMSRPLGQEAKRLWELIRKGEPALCHWDKV